MPGDPKDFLNVHTTTFSANKANGKDMGLFFDVPTTHYTISSKAWTVPVNGYIVSYRGHEHDGGSGVSVSINGKTACSSLPTYAEIGNKGVTEGKHFSVTQFSLCNEKVKISKGNQLVVKADYDTEKYPQ